MYSPDELERIRIDRLNGRTFTVTEIRHLVEMVKRNSGTNGSMSDDECIVYGMLSEIKN